MYAIIRADIEMTPGKAAAQAGHAFLEAFLAAETNPYAAKSAKEYRNGGTTGTKICLAASKTQMELLEQKLMRTIMTPWAKIQDSGHIHPPDFDGTPILTAIGIGPCEKSAFIESLVGHFPLYKGPFSSGVYKQNDLEKLRSIKKQIKALVVEQKAGNIKLRPTNWDFSNGHPIAYVDLRSQKFERREKIASLHREEGDIVTRLKLSR